MIGSSERAAVLECGDSRLTAVLHAPAEPSRGVVYVFVVGGPQYRVGSHRMFVKIARVLAGDGNAVLRFDCRGMGDSDGIFESFERLDRDIGCAVDAAASAFPGFRLTLLGLCDGASACVMYAPSDRRVSGLVLLNPWVHTITAEAKARVGFYYPRRLLQRDFWTKLVTGRVHVVESMRSLICSLSRMRRSKGGKEVGYIERMRSALAGFAEQITVLLSENDLTAREFVDLIEGDRRWADLMARANVSVRRLEGTDHTFSGEGQLEHAARCMLAL